MYIYNNNMIPEKRSGWRNAYEIEIAAREHEKQRFQMNAKPGEALMRSRLQLASTKSGGSKCFLMETEKQASCPFLRRPCVYLHS